MPSNGSHDPKGPGDARGPADDSPRRRRFRRPERDNPRPERSDSPRPERDAGASQASTPSGEPRENANKPSQGAHRRRDRFRPRNRDNPKAPGGEARARPERKGPDAANAPSQEEPPRQPRPRPSRAPQPPDAPQARPAAPQMRHHAQGPGRHEGPHPNKGPARPQQRFSRAPAAPAPEQSSPQAEPSLRPPPSHGRRGGQPRPQQPMEPSGCPKEGGGCGGCRCAGPPVFLAPSSPPGELDQETAIDLTPWEADIDDGHDDGVLHNVVTLRLAHSGRLRDFDAGDNLYNRGETLAVEGESGSTNLGAVVQPCRRMMCRNRLPRVLRKVPGEPDTSAESRAKRRETEVFRIAKHVANTLNLPVKVVRAEAETNGKVVVYFASEERVDFRELFRRVSAAAQGGVELRQVGVRDAAKLLGGVGPCGLQLCCTSFLREFAPVSIKMAKEQGLVLNPNRVSGLCGRLLCCLTYEDSLYRSQRKLLPKLGKRVITPRGPGKVRDVDVLAQLVRVTLETGEIVTLPPGDITPMFPTTREPGKADDGSPSAGRGPDGEQDEDDEESGALHPPEGPGPKR